MTRDISVSSSKDMGMYFSDKDRRYRRYSYEFDMENQPPHYLEPTVTDLASSWSE